MHGLRTPQFEKAEQDAAKLIDGEKKKIKTITTTISENETKTAALAKQFEDATKASSRPCRAGQGGQEGSARMHACMHMHAAPMSD
jgi:hypothetical protein